MKMESERFSVDEIERLCERIRKKRKKTEIPEKTDPQYWEYLKGLEYHSFLDPEILRSECDKLKKTAAAKGEEEKKKLETEIELLERALGSWPPEADEEELVKLRKDANLKLILRGGGDENKRREQIVGLELRYFYFLSPDSLLKSRNPKKTENRKTQRLYDKTFLEDLKDIFERSKEEYGTVMEACCKSNGSRISCEEFCKNLETYEDNERQRHLNNKENREEFVHEIREKLGRPLLAAADDKGYQQALFIAVRYPAAILLLYSSGSPEKERVYQGDEFEQVFQRLQELYRIERKEFLQAAPFLNITVPQGTGSKTEERPQNLTLVVDYIRNVIPKQQREAEDYFRWFEKKAGDPDSGELQENMRDLQDNLEKFTDLYKRWDAERKLIRDVEPSEDSEMGQSIARSDRQMEQMRKYIAEKAVSLTKYYEKLLNPKEQEIFGYRERAKSKIDQLYALQNDAKGWDIVRKTINLRNEIYALADEMYETAAAWKKENALYSGIEKALQGEADALRDGAANMVQNIKKKSGQEPHRGCLAVGLKVIFLPIFYYCLYLLYTDYRIYTWSEGEYCGSILEIVLGVEEVITESFGGAAAFANMIIVLPFPLLAVYCVLTRKRISKWGGLIGGLEVILFLGICFHLSGGTFSTANIPASTMAWGVFGLMIIVAAIGVFPGWAISYTFELIRLNVFVRSKNKW